MEDKDNDFVCPICFNLIREAHMTRCGHTFCFECIMKCFETNSRCPKCNYDLENRQKDIFPNFLLNELVAKHKTKLEQLSKKKGGLSQSPSFASSTDSGLLSSLYEPGLNLSLSDCESMIRALSERKDELLNQSLLVEYKLLREFLTQLKRIKDDELIRLKRETSVIQDDLSLVENLLKNVQELKIEEFSPDSNSAKKDQAIVPNLMKPSTSEGFNLFKKKEDSVENVMEVRRKHMQKHFDDLTTCYFNNRVQKILFPPDANSASGHQEEEDSEGFYEFSSSLNSFTRYSGLRHLATLSYTTDMFNNASIVSSIEFDNAQELFAIAGVTKRIKIYNYNTVLKDTVDIHYPCIEMVCGSKISCVAWNAFHQSTLASSDYDCAVIVWDALTASKVVAVVPVSEYGVSRLNSLFFRRSPSRNTRSGAGLWISTRSTPSC